MKKFRMAIMAACIIVVAIPSCIFAGDKLHRMMHNNHDTLVIGEVVEVTDQLYTIKIHDTIVSDHDMYPDDPFEQLKPDIMKISRKDGEVFSSYRAAVGDFVLISADKVEGDLFKVAWGAYIVDSPNKQTLKILADAGTTESEKMDFAAIEYFVHSDGKSTEFVFDGTMRQLSVYEDDDHIEKKLIYDKSADKTYSLQSVDTFKAESKVLEEKERTEKRTRYWAWFSLSVSVIITWKIVRRNI